MGVINRGSGGSLTTGSIVNGSVVNDRVKTRLHLFLL